PPTTALTPLPLNRTTFAPLKFDPVTIAPIEKRAVPMAGVIAVIVGLTTVYPLNAGDVPAVVVTVKVRVSRTALLAMEIVIGKLESVPPGRIPAVTPVPLNVTAVAPAKPVPAIVAKTDVPIIPFTVLILVIVGAC